MSSSRTTAQCAARENTIGDSNSHWSRLHLYFLTWRLSSESPPIRYSSSLRATSALCGWNGRFFSVENHSFWTGLKQHNGISEKPPTTYNWPPHTTAACRVRGHGIIGNCNHFFVARTKPRVVEVDPDLWPPVRTTTVSLNLRHNRGPCNNT